MDSAIAATRRRTQVHKRVASGYCWSAGCEWARRPAPRRASRNRSGGKKTSYRTVEVPAVDVPESAGRGLSFAVGMEVPDLLMVSVTGLTTMTMPPVASVDGPCREQRT